MGANFPLRALFTSLDAHFQLRSSLFLVAGATANDIGAVQLLYGIGAQRPSRLRGPKEHTFRHRVIGAISAARASLGEGRAIAGTSLRLGRRQVEWALVLCRRSHRKPAREALGDGRAVVLPTRGPRGVVRAGCGLPADALQVSERRV